MRTIWKFSLETTDEQEFVMPADAEPLCVQIQHDVPCLWVHVDTAKPLVQRRVYIVGTGNPVEVENVTYIGTYQLHDGHLVWHVLVADKPAIPDSAMPIPPVEKS